MGPSHYGNQARIYGSAIGILPSYGHVLARQVATSLRFASYADDIAAGADTLEELFELLKALILECFDKAGIQVKASKLIFGVREISFHNYTISKDQTRPKDENLCPIRNMSTPRSMTELLKAFLGCTQQMSQYCRYYGIVASPLHRLMPVTEPFPKQWLLGTDYDIAFHRIKMHTLALYCYSSTAVHLAVHFFCCLGQKMF